jgi:hypothetical protein
MALDKSLFFPEHWFGNEETKLQDSKSAFTAKQFQLWEAYSLSHCIHKSFPKMECQKKPESEAWIKCLMETQICILDSAQNK